MRRTEFAIAVTLAFVMFFADLAPRSHDLEASPIAADGGVTTQAKTAPATTADNVEPSIMADDLDSAITAGNTAVEELQDVSPDVPANSKKPTSLERAKAALAGSSAAALSDRELCTTLVEVARSNDLPLGFFTNLIWRESRFDHDAISPVGAMGIAQFMPDVADKLSLDAFDSRSALPASARLLRTLRARFGNLGLAAAAYNAGPKRVSDWLEGRSALPRETQDYVYLITGRPAALWQRPQTVVFRVPRQVPCHRLETFASAEQIQRAQQERIAAEEARIAELKAREAALRRLAELKQKSKNVARSARLQIASRVQATKSAAPSQTAKSTAAPRQAKIRVAQLKR
jgi:soluble lytic murein transglycosylase-like protein